MNDKSRVVKNDNMRLIQSKELFLSEEGPKGAVVSMCWGVLISPQRRNKWIKNIVDGEKRER
jgi:hypothetical protein